MPRSHFRCVVCDIRKPDAERLAGRDWCDGCGRRTDNREVAAPLAPLAPGSAMTFKDQKKVYRETMCRR